MTETIALAGAGMMPVCGGAALLDEFLPDIRISRGSRRTANRITVVFQLGQCFAQRFTALAGAVGGG